MEEGRGTIYGSKIKHKKITGTEVPVIFISLVRELRSHIEICTSEICIVCSLVRWSNVNSHRSLLSLLNIERNSLTFCKGVVNINLTYYSGEVEEKIFTTLYWTNESEPFVHHHLLDLTNHKKEKKKNKTMYKNLELIHTA